MSKNVVTNPMLDHYLGQDVIVRFADGTCGGGKLVKKVGTKFYNLLPSDSHPYLRGESFDFLQDAVAELQN